MCGRIACTLHKNDLQHATKKYCFQEKLPMWIEKFSWQTYKPSYNIGPTEVMPVLVKHCVGITPENYNDVALIPMKWGLVPNWSNSSSGASKVSPFNCRSETVLDLPIFKSAVAANRRCVIVADGFFEWKTENKTKVPYFIHSPDRKDFSMKMRKWDSTEQFVTEESDWIGPHLLAMAGIYEVAQHPEHDCLYSYSILTIESSKTLQSIHTRMPAILSGVEEVQTWLDVEHTPINKAMHNLCSVEDIDLYEVSTAVNNTKNDCVQCVLPCKSGAQVNKQKRISSYFKAVEKSEVVKKMKF